MNEVTSKYTHLPAMVTTEWRLISAPSSSVPAVEDNLVELRAFIEEHATLTNSEKFHEQYKFDIEEAAGDRPVSTLDGKTQLEIKKQAIQDLQEGHKRQKELDEKAEPGKAIQLPEQVAKIYRGKTSTDAMQQLWIGPNDNSSLKAVKAEADKVDQTNEGQFSKPEAVGRKFPLAEITGQFQLAKGPLEQYMRNQNVADGQGVPIINTIALGLSSFAVNMRRKSVPWESYVPPEPRKVLKDIYKAKIGSRDIFPKFIKSTTSRSDIFRPIEGSIKAITKNPDDKESEKAVIDYNPNLDVLFRVPIDDLKQVSTYKSEPQKSQEEVIEKFLPIIVQLLFPRYSSGMVTRDQRDRRSARGTQDRPCVGCPAHSSFRNKRSKVDHDKWSDRSRYRTLSLLFFIFRYRN